MPREYLLYLEDMRESARKVQRYTAGLSFHTFSENDLVLDATLHNLEIIGEAAKNIPDEVKARYPDLNWRAMSRFRDVLSRHYFGVRLETVRLETIWDVVIHEIPQLLNQVEVALKAERGTASRHKERKRSRPPLGSSFGAYVGVDEVTWGTGGNLGG